MKTYDLHVHTNLSSGENSIAEMVSLSQRLGWSGLAVCDHWTDIKALKKAEDAVSSARQQGFDVALGVEIKTSSPGDVGRTAKKLRRRVDVVMVSGGNAEINRAAVETPEVDILSHPEFQRNDSGLDHVMAKLAAENNVCVEFNFRQLLYNFRKSRAHVLAHMRQNAKLCHKFNTPFVITSGAYSKWDLRGPRELAAMGQMIGFDLEKSMAALSGTRLEENRAKRMRMNGEGKNG